MHPKANGFDGENRGSNDDGTAVLLATATCPTGSVALGGGGRIATAVAPAKVAFVRSSYPSSTTQWTVEAVVIRPLNRDETVTATAYVLCSVGH
jgi:hypothetical protein